MLTPDLKKAMCDLFDVLEDENGVQLVVTPLEYPGSNDQIVIRVRPISSGWQIDENGEASLIASMSGGDLESDLILRLVDEFESSLSIYFDENETLLAKVNNSNQIAPYIFHIASAAQQLFSVATSQNTKERTSNNFKEQVSEIVHEIASALDFDVKDNFELPIGGALIADHFIETSIPLIIFSASTNVRLLEAEITHMQYQLENTPGFVLAIAESEKSVGKKQYSRANYYTGKTVLFSPLDLPQLLKNQIRH